MATTYPTDLRQQVAEFAATYPTANVQRAVHLATAGTLTWEQVYDLFKEAMAKGLATVAEPAAQRDGMVQCPNGCGHWVMADVYIDPTLECPR